MRDPDHLAELLAHAAAIYRARAGRKTFDTLIEMEQCQKLNAYMVLSIRAIAAILGISTYKVERYTNGQPRPGTRGKLNPHHLTMLAYMLSDGKVRDEWLTKMLSEGTSISTISDLTNISEATLYRKRTRKGGTDDRDCDLHGEQTDASRRGGPDGPSQPVS